MGAVKFSRVREVGEAGTTHDVGLELFAEERSETSVACQRGMQPVFPLPRKGRDQG